MTATVGASGKLRDGSEGSFEFTESDFNALRKLVYEHTGITLAEHKRDLVYGRLSKRLRARGMSRFKDYREFLESSPEDEMEHFTNAITTNLTAFFRERHHFDYLGGELVSKLMESYRVNRRLRFWCAGCSTGEEPYSLAITLRESIPNIDNMDVKILASDLDSNVVRTASMGVYPEGRIAALSGSQKKRWFKKGSGNQNGMVRASQELRDMISFRQLNLMHPWPMKGPFDVIFCRNVVIYFDKPTQSVLFDRYAEIMRPEGKLFIGHSENISGVTKRFELIGKTVYKRVS